MARGSSLRLSEACCAAAGSEDLAQRQPHSPACVADSPASLAGRSGARPKAGSTLARRAEGVPDEEARECWDECDGTSFMVGALAAVGGRARQRGAGCWWRCQPPPAGCAPGAPAGAGAHVAERLCLAQVRSVDYMRTKVKVPSSKAFYKLVGVDFFTCDTKTGHVAQLVQLPQVRAGAGSSAEHVPQGRPWRGLAAAWG
jgi:hypothetical protein